MGDRRKSTTRKLRCSAPVIEVPTESGSVTVPCHMPQIESSITISVQPTYTLLIMELDRRSIPESVYTYYEADDGMLHVVYDRIFVVESLAKLGSQMLTGAQHTAETSDCYYEVTTHIAHTFRFSKQAYLLMSARVRQNCRTVLITVAHATEERTRSESSEEVE
ncbi:unnamed protein product [Dicrocoelium dendriticum]|nr:unnamed protein product [Dicrocoelium dendriticum]